MSVRKNIGFGLMMRGVARAEAERRVDEAARNYQLAIASPTTTAADLDAARRALEDANIALRAAQERERLEVEAMNADVARMRNDLDAAQRASTLTPQLLAARQADLISRQQELEQFRQERQDAMNRRAEAAAAQQAEAAGLAAEEAAAEAAAAERAAEEAARRSHEQAAAWQPRTFEGVSFQVPAGAWAPDTVDRRPVTSWMDGPSLTWNGPLLDGGRDGFVRVMITATHEGGLIPTDGGEWFTVPGADKAYGGIDTTDYAGAPTRNTTVWLDILDGDRLVRVSAEFPGGPKGEQMARELIASISTR
jgi:hypothetical protein